MSEVLSTELKQKIDAWAKRYPEQWRRSAVIEALRMVQEEYSGSLQQEHMDAVAAHLGMQPIEVYEVASFYDMYELKPVGENLICICTNVSCDLCGAWQLVAWFKQRLGIGLGETSNDGKYTLKEVECMGACCGAPMCQVNNRHYHENLTAERVARLIDFLEAGHEPTPQEVANEA